MAEKIFSELKVIELASVLAGPSVGMFFAELGARVIKYENKLQNGDVTRSWKLPSEGENSISSYFSSINYNKEYVLIDYKNEADYDALITEIKKSDIIICNFKHGAAEKFKLDYSTLSHINSELIYCQLNGFESNPDRVAFDVVIQAETGYMYMNGPTDGDPTKMPLAMMDILAGHQMKEGILTALWKREQTKKGSYVECSLETAAIASLANQATNYLMANKIPTRIGSLHPNIAPYGEVFKTSDDKLVVLAVGSEAHFKKLLNIIGAEELLDRKELSSNRIRVENRILLHQLLSPYFAQLKCAPLIKSCIAVDVPIGEIKNLEQVFQSEVASKMILEEDIQGSVTRRVQSVAFRIQ
ncbi:MAG: crotonobetainyl-CoA:carnitine CoA-transferase CaiB-like acyl-CoA transferase [Flavobacteriales bacterium]|jgi:crotonobetainyl-CoA:carnitine CoA-transferase CaiB-like acyl-CoA transferase